MEAKRHLIESRNRQLHFGYQNIGYGYEPLRDFFVDFMLGQDLSDIKPSLRKRFIDRGGVQDGLTILGIAAIMASQAAMVKGESFDVVYSRMRRRGRLHPAMPERAGILYYDKLGGHAGRLALLPELRTRLTGEPPAENRLAAVA